MPKNTGVTTPQVDDATATAATGTEGDADTATDDSAFDFTPEEFEQWKTRAETAEAKVAAFELRDQKHAWATEIVKDSAVPVEALRGETKEEMQQHFDILAALVKATATTPIPRSTPPGKSVDTSKKLDAAQAIRLLRQQ